MAREYKGEVGTRLATIRLRTWTLTLAVLVALVFYLLMKVVFKDTIDVVDFIMLATLQVLMHCIYFPDGELYGQKDKCYVANRQSYNNKATEINRKRKIAKLREYCVAEYEERKRRYIEMVCGTIGISVTELEILREKVPQKEIKKLKSYEFVYEDGSKLIPFSKWKSAKLYNLLYGKLPVKPNHAETIMSAVDNNGTEAITDRSKGFKARAYIKKVIMAFGVGAFLAYVGYTSRDGIGMAEITRIITCLVSMFSTAVLSYSTGETCSKVYKNRYYIDLVNFIDGFNEWCGEQPEPEIVEEETEE